MKISHIDVYKYDIDLTHPIVVPIGVLSAANNIVLRISTDCGIQGWGEASPFAPITSDSQESNFAAARSSGEKLLGKDPRQIECRLDEIEQALIGEPSLLAAFDMALYDILGQAGRLPLYQLLGGKRRPMHTDITIGLQDSVAGTLKRVDECLANGFNELKLKVGRPGLADVEHIAAVRNRVGERVQIRIDANQGWDYSTALSNLQSMVRYKLEYCEQPLPAGEYEGLKKLSGNVEIPICADESMFDDKDAFKLLATEAVEYLNIKLGKSGGIRTALRIEAISRAAGKKCMIGCFAESRLGLTASAHLAAARPNIEFIDLDSAYGFVSDPVEGGIRLGRGGQVELPDVAGLGATVSMEFLDGCEQYRIE